MTVLEDRSSGFFTAFLNMDAHPQVHISCPGSCSEYGFSSSSASIPHVQNVIKAPPYLIVKQSLVSVVSVSLHNRKRTTQAYEMRH